MDVRTENFFPIVGIGASAGGLDAFREFLKAIPADSGTAYILVQHLAATHESVLTEILQKSTTLPVVEIANEMQIFPDHIYVIPSNAYLTVKDNFLQLEPIAKGERLNTIDTLFTSLAEVHQQQSIGILLSGSGNDGTVGLKTIRDQGGITMVQSEETAGYFDMARNALEADVVDFVLAPAEMPGRLSEILRSSDRGIGLAAMADAPAEKDSFKRILELLKAKRGVDFKYYKESTIHRRISRRQAMTGRDSLKQYVDFLLESKTEQDALFKDILIPVTAFFRDASTFDSLVKDIFPELFADHKSPEPKRIWVAGCSTGEEAYSIAMSIQEYYNDSALLAEIQIFATDISEASISKARTGIYSKQNMAGVSEERLSKFFAKTEGGYRVNKSLREMCVFAAQNFLQDPPFAKLDLISCRNVLIYMEPYLQKRALTTFHYALKNSGVLLLGRSESVGTLSSLFSLISSRDKFYRRNNAIGRFIPSTQSVGSYSKKWIPEAGSGADIRKDDLQKAADDALLEKYAAVGVVVNDQFDVVQFRGSTGAYLEAPSGKVTLNVLKMAKEGLAFELRNALLKVKASGVAVRKEGISLENASRRVNTEVIPLRNTLEPCYLILFQESNGGDIPGSGAKSTYRRKISGTDIQQLRITELERDLAQARDDMRAITENQEAANEELQSANEELLSGSEELQTLNEELETSKEEIQSSNEELTILNQELIDRNDQLIHARKYAEAIVTTLHEPLIVLSRDFRIKSANTCFYETFQRTEKLTEGQPFFEWNNGMWNIPALRSALETVLPQQAHFEDLSVQIGQGEKRRQFAMNARKVINDNSNEQLILLAMQDVTEKKALEHVREEFAKELESKIEQQTRELMELNEGLRYSNESLKQFNSIASHDLQEPLRKIRTFSVMLGRSMGSLMSEESTTLLSKISASVDRMSLLIKDVLQFSKLDRAERTYPATSLDDVLKDVLSDLDLLIAETDATISCPKPLPVIEAIPLQMHQLFLNLIGNGLKFRKRGSRPSIRIGYTLLLNQPLGGTDGSAAASPSVEIKVSDNGIGFEQGFSQQIFLLFERLHTTDEFEGTGVGLALCKRIVENHGGKITAESQEDEGATFIVTLPVKH